MNLTKKLKLKESPKPKRWSLVTDWGGVIIDNINVDRTSRYSITYRGPRPRFFEVLPVPGALQTIEWLHKNRFRLGIGSRIDLDPPYIEGHTRAWLHYHGVHRFIPSKNWRFCEKIAHKKHICEEFCPDFFLDDNLGSHEPLLHTVEHLILFRPPWTPRHVTVRDRRLFSLVRDGRVKLAQSMADVRRIVGSIIGRTARAPL